GQTRGFSVLSRGNHSCPQRHRHPADRVRFCRHGHCYRDTIQLLTPKHNYNGKLPLGATNSRADTFSGSYLPAVTGLVILVTACDRVVATNPQEPDFAVASALSRGTAGLSAALPDVS